MADRGRPIAGQQQRQRIGPGKPLAQIAQPEPRRLLRLARGVEEADQIAARKLDIATDVAPEQRVERRPPEQRPQDLGPRDRDGGAARRLAAERDQRAVPEPDRERNIELLRQMPEHPPRRFEVSFRQSGFPRLMQRSRKLVSSRPYHVMPEPPCSQYLGSVKPSVGLTIMSLASNHSIRHPALGLAASAHPPAQLDQPRHEFGSRIAFRVKPGNDRARQELHGCTNARLRDKPRGSRGWRAARRRCLRGPRGRSRARSRDGRS